MERVFLQHYFPATLVVVLRKEISGAMQGLGEALYEYWESFKCLIVSCLQHQIRDQLLIQYFYEGLTLTDRDMFDAASGEALMGKTQTATQELISSMATNTQQFGTCDVMTKPVDESKNDALEKIASMMETFFKGKTPEVRPCKLCSTIEHTTNDCRILNDEIEQHANAISFGNFQGHHMIHTPTHIIRGGGIILIYDMGINKPINLEKIRSPGTQNVISNYLEGMREVLNLLGNTMVR
ncbi:hypothetical protein ACS0TY_034861 [Phlomoides rotata]